MQGRICEKPFSLVTDNFEQYVFFSRDNRYFYTVNYSTFNTLTGRRKGRDGSCGCEEGKEKATAEVEELEIPGLDELLEGRDRATVTRLAILVLGDPTRQVLLQSLLFSTFLNQ